MAKVSLRPVVGTVKGWRSSRFCRNLGTHTSILLWFLLLANRYFKDNEFRRQIDQDVKRTFPEIDFFREARVQEELLNVLFCYSKKYPDLSYRQGMYECKLAICRA